MESNKGFDERLYAKGEFYWKDKLLNENGIVLEKKKIIILGKNKKGEISREILMNRNNDILLDDFW